MLKVNRLTGYSIAIISTMLKNSNDTGLFTAAGISKETNLPLATVIKILKQLSSVDIVKSQRGIKGGYLLLPMSDSLSFADIIEKLEGPININDCEIGKDCYIKNSCPIRFICNDANAKIRNVLDEIKIKDVASRI